VRSLAAGAQRRRGAHTRHGVAGRRGERQAHRLTQRCTPTNQQPCLATFWPPSGHLLTTFWPPSGHLLTTFCSPAQALNNGAVPTIATAWQGVAESESRRAAEVAEAAYFEAFNPDTNVGGGARAKMGHTTAWQRLNTAPRVPPAFASRSLLMYRFEPLPLPPPADLQTLVASLPVHNYRTDTMVWGHGWG
jgi:hypothetical protein